MPLPNSLSSIPGHATGVLLLADGSCFYGDGFGKLGIATGELCFNTAMSGHQEILTDPSYTQQIIAFTFPHIGNVGANVEDDESKGAYARGCIVRELPTASSNYRAEEDFSSWLRRQGIVGIAGIDTRLLTQYIRKVGPQNAVVCHFDRAHIPDMAALHKALAVAPDMKSLELAGTVTTETTYTWQQSKWQWQQGYTNVLSPSFRVVVIDYGVKHNILRALAQLGCEVIVVPATTNYAIIAAYNPDGVFLSNGPGDPAATFRYAGATIGAILDAGIPLMGICLGHQLLALALGGNTVKMKQGHRGGNHPVLEHATGRVSITSQNHGFAVLDRNLPANVDVTHVSLFDGSVEGIALRDRPVFSVQYHPEASPGPHDSAPLFEQFLKLLEAERCAVPPLATMSS